MSEEITLIDFKTPGGNHYKRVITRVVKAKDRVKSDDDYMHEHNIAMLKLLIRNPRYVKIAVEEVRKVALDGVK